MTMQENDTRDMLADSIGRLFSEQITPELIREVEEGHWPASLWQLLQEQGFDLALVPEDAGGLGLSWDTVYPVLFACGRHTLPLPLPEVMLGNWLLGKAGVELPEGRVTLAQLPSEAVQAAGDGSVQVHGTLRDVPWACGAGHLVVCATLDGQEHVGLLSLGTAALEGELNIAREPRHTVHFDAPVAVRMVPVPGLARQIASHPPLSLRLTKQLLRESTHQSLSSSLELAAAYQALAHHTKDHDEAVLAFLEKREPSYRGE